MPPSPTPNRLSWSSEQYYRRYVTQLAAHYGIPERELFAYVEWREACRAFTRKEVAA